MSTLILTYCRDFADYVRFAGAIGRHFLMRGIPSIVVDSDPRARELRGVPIERRRYMHAARIRRAAAISPYRNRLSRH
jgi:hypothetical protein